MNTKRIEDVGKRIFARTPRLKRALKRIYQYLAFLLSHESLKAEGDVIRITPDDGFDYFFGYYDKSPWDADDRYVIALKVKCAYKDPAPKEPGTLVLIDTLNNNSVKEIAVTHSWNSQQGCMAQWLGPDFKSRIIYNDFRYGKFVSVVFDMISNSEEREYPLPVYDVAKDGSYALSLDFSRLHRLRPGYGYSNLPDTTVNEACPDKPCIWKLDLLTGEVTEWLKYTNFAALEPDGTMIGSEHKVNHIMISPDGGRVMVLHRWFGNGKKYTRLVTINAYGGDMYNLSDDVFISHCYWKNNSEILSFLRKNGTGDHYYLMKDKMQEYCLLWPELDTDGHCSFSPDGEFVITDTYPNKSRVASVYLCKESGDVQRIARVFSPFKYDNDCRCDLHPRWNRRGDQICIDSVHEESKSLYFISVDADKSNSEQNSFEQADWSVSAIITTHNRKELLKKAVSSALAQTYPISEVVVVSDGSNDGTDEMMQEWSNTEPKIKYISYYPGKGGNFARNTGIKNSNSAYVAFLDDDDEWHTDKVERQIMVFQQDKSIGLVCTAINRVVLPTGESTMYIPLIKKPVSKNILLSNFIGTTSTVMVKRDLFCEAGNFDQSLPALQDYDMWIRLCQITNVGVVDKPCVEYYIDASIEQISCNTDQYITAQEKINEKYAVLISGLTAAEQRRRLCYLNMLLAKKGMRNSQNRLAIKYALKAVAVRPCKNSLACLAAAFIPYRTALKFRRVLFKRGLN